MSPFFFTGLHHPCSGTGHVPLYPRGASVFNRVGRGRDIYFFANSTDAAVEATVVLRGHKDLAAWDPHTGQRKKADVTASETAGQPMTTTHLALPPLTSVFYVQE